MIDYLIVGAGFSGAVLAERIATQLNKKVLIVEKRDHIGGNAHDFYNEAGILVHKYGPHIFHTNSSEVWDYVSQFTKWRIYFHTVLAVVEGNKIPIPFNLNSVYKCFSPKLAESLENKLINIFGYGKKISIFELLKTKDRDLKFLSDYIYQNIFLKYNIKQWGVKPEELDKSVASRVPIYISRDNRYFTDKYQGIPMNGYTQMFKNMLAHHNIKILLKTDYKEIIDLIKFDKLIFTGPVDLFMDYLYGELPYRSLRFKFFTLNQPKFQEVAQINYPNNYEYTRITEFKHLSGQKHLNTTIAYEFPEAYSLEKNEPYYPIPTSENNELYKKYLKKINMLKNVIFLGRLADYKYYNMDQVIAKALMIFKKKIAKS